MILQINNDAPKSTCIITQFIFYYNNKGSNSLRAHLVGGATCLPAGRAQYNLLVLVVCLAQTLFLFRTNTTKL